jgi:hypothetical protein
MVEFNDLPDLRLESNGDALIPAAVSLISETVAAERVSAWWGWRLHDLSMHKRS